MKKILILAANPRQANRLRLDEEVREIQEGLQRSKQREHFVLQAKWAVRLRDLRRALLDHEPQIVHFCGHGDEHGLAVEDEAGNTTPISASGLSDLFALCETVECVILNTCYSEAQASAISSHVPYVIGMEGELSDQAAVEFAVGFYDALGAGRPFSTAFRFGRNAIELNKPTEQVEPILKYNPSINRGTVNDIDVDLANYVYKFRAECEQDVDELRRVLGVTAHQIVKTIYMPFPDVVVELHAPLPLEGLRNMMRRIPDGHVMVQTVALKKDYTGERDYTIS